MRGAEISNVNNINQGITGWRSHRPYIFYKMGLGLDSMKKNLFQVMKFGRVFTSRSSKVFQGEGKDNLSLKKSLRPSNGALLHHPSNRKPRVFLLYLIYHKNGFNRR